MTRPAALCALGLATALPALSVACPGCQNPNLPVVPTGGVHLGGGDLQWGALLSLAPIWVRHEDGCVDLAACAKIPAQPKYVHDQFILPTELRATLDWGLSSHWGLSVQLPVRLVATTIEYETPTGEPYEPLDAGNHHRDEVLVGLGDPVVAARVGGVVGEAWWVVARLGASLPLGRTEPNPFTAGDQGEAHQHIQFGSGTLDPFASLAVARSAGPWQWSAYGQVQAALYENSEGFQAGTTSLVSAGAAWRAAPRWLLQGSLAWFRQGAERWDGKIQQDGVLGRQELLVGLGTTVSFGGPQYLLLVRAPVWREIFQGPDTEEGDLTAPVVLTVGVQGRI
ncbi:MAG: hypothetical protein KC613_13520 [Myxococcales bacterium]|nr:hypothetical protein [Myxococcales bacterium]MCB9524460.1 hypothetical protein [Myxococcales bacterium]